MPSQTIIHGEMLIGDILARYPESEQIMLDFGLHCTSCSVNAFEPIKAGAMSHGLDEEVVDGLISKLNDLAIAQRKAPVDGIYVSPRASAKIKEFAEKEEKPGFALRITAKDNEGMEPAYAMDFEEKAKKTDKTFEFNGVAVLLDKESLKNLQGADIDFLETQFGSGFKINNPQFMKGGCGCGSGGGSCCGGESEGCGC